MSALFDAIIFGVGATLGWMLTTVTVGLIAVAIVAYYHGKDMEE